MKNSGRVKVTRYYRGNEVIECEPKQLSCNDEPKKKASKRSENVKKDSKKSTKKGKGTRRNGK
ncbi:MAG: hypothetical protein RR945_00435 [Erysipelotrichaceae bacterium]